VKKAVAKKPPTLGPLKQSLALLKSLRKQKDTLVDETIPNLQKEVLPALKVLDPDGKGVVFELDGEELAGWYQQNAAGEFWDIETLVPWLRRNKNRWMACSSRVFDSAKFEAEIANGNIRPQTVAKFKKTGNAPSPFVRIDKPKKDSLR
jgi:hypothetical protein